MTAAHDGRVVSGTSNGATRFGGAPACAAAVYEAFDRDLPGKIATAARSAGRDGGRRAAREGAAPLGGRFALRFGGRPKRSVALGHGRLTTNEIKKKKKNK